MAAERVYSVDFKRGDLTPTLDTLGWGPMVVGDSGPAANPVSSGDPQGLTLSVTGAGGPAGIGVHVVFDEDELSLETRLVCRVEFERPQVVSGNPEPWAVALAVKFGDESFAGNEKLAAVTCQFRPTGVRLNTPQHLEGDQAVDVISMTPVNYGALTPGHFTLEHYFCGVNAAGRQAVGFGTLSIGAPIGEDDQRVYSNAQLSDGSQDWIGALGVTLATLTGNGRFSVRLRSFSVAMWGISP